MLEWPVRFLPAKEERGCYSCSRAQLSSPIKKAILSLWPLKALTPQSPLKSTSLLCTHTIFLISIRKLMVDGEASQPTARQKWPCLATEPAEAPRPNDVWGHGQWGGPSLRPLILDHQWKQMSGVENEGKNRKGWSPICLSINHWDRHCEHIISQATTSAGKDLLHPEFLISWEEAVRPGFKFRGLGYIIRCLNSLGYSSLMS